MKVNKPKGLSDDSLIVLGKEKKTITEGRGMEGSGLERAQGGQRRNIIRNWRRKQA